MRIEIYVGLGIQYLTSGHQIDFKTFRKYLNYYFLYVSHINVAKLRLANPVYSLLRISTGGRDAAQT